MKRLKKLDSVGGAPIILSAAAARRQIFIGAAAWGTLTGRGRSDLSA